MDSSAPPVSASLLFAQLCCLFSAAWTTQNFTWKFALIFIPLPRQRQWQERHQSCKFITTLLITRESQKRSKPLCLWAFHSPWKDSCLPNLKGEVPLGCYFFSPNVSPVSYCFTWRWNVCVCRNKNNVVDRNKSIHSMKLLSLCCACGNEFTTQCEVCCEQDGKMAQILEGHPTLVPLQECENGLFAWASQLVGYSLLLQNAAPSVCYLSDACASKSSNCSSQYSPGNAWPRDVALSPGFPLCLSATPKCLSVCRGNLEEGKNKKKMGEGCCLLSADLCLPAYVLNEELEGGWSD